MLVTPIRLIGKLPLVEHLAHEPLILSGVDAQRGTRLFLPQVVVQDLLLELLSRQRVFNNSRKNIFFVFFFYRGCGGKVFFFAFF